MTTPEPVLAVRNLCKTFPGQRALRGVSMEVLPGEIHALLGQNGSGKSTLIKCLSGYHRPDAGGQFILDGVTLPFGYGSDEAHSFGMGFVHQDLGIIPSLSVLENFCVGKGFATGPARRIRWQVEAKRVREFMREFGHDISPWSLVRHLPSAERTIVAIVRAFSAVQEKGGCLLVLDEPTAALPEAEVRRLFSAVRAVANRGMGVLYVTHRLQEVFELADRATVLRDGALVGTYQVANLTERRLVELIVGRAIDSYYPEASSHVDSDALLEADALTGETVDGASFVLRRGEVVGVAGLLGSGCSELGRLIFGAEQRRTGRLRFKGREVSYRHPAEAISDGIGMITEDRRRDGSFAQLSIGDNLTITDLRRFWRAGRINRAAEKAEISRLVREFGVQPPDPDRAFYTLSGGNQQKVVLAKWMRLQPDLLICDEPVVGVDIGSKTDIYGLIVAAAAAGAAVLLISSEFKDLERLCTKVLVMRQGKVVATLSGADLTESRIAELAYLPVSKNEVKTA